MLCASPLFVFFFFNDTATTEIYTLSLHDALPISQLSSTEDWPHPVIVEFLSAAAERNRSEEHTSELQSHLNLVCRLLLEKKKIRRTQEILQPPLHSERC